MRAPASLLHPQAAELEQQASSAPAASPPPPPTTTDQQQPVVAVDSDMVVILASFLCALVCVLGLALVSRCACRGLRRRRAASSSDAAQHAPTPTPPPPRGLKKKAIDALPTVSFTAAAPSPAPPPCPPASECAICLADFAEGEALRVLPRCGHGFHVACVDAWLRTRATCPSCRAAIVAAQAPPVVATGAACGRCGQVLPPPPPPPPPAPPGPGAAGDDTFLP